MDIVKTFDTVHRNRLKNIFLKYCSDYRIWNEINKLLKAEIISLKTNSIGDLGISKCSVLSPFLFNVYMTEFDNFMELLKHNSMHTVFCNNSPVQNELVQSVCKTRTKKKLANISVEHNSFDLVSAHHKKKRSIYHKRHGLVNGENKILCQITYVRYADDFVVGITGPKNFALRIASEIKSFIKSDLHFCVRDVALIGVGKGVVKFLGFNIYLSSVKNKVRTKPNKIKSIVNYKKRSIARLKGNDARIGQAYFNSIKHGFLNYFRDVYEKLDLKKSKDAIMLSVKYFVNKNLEELFLINSSQELTVPNPNLALRRFIKHFKDLFCKNMDISLKVWEEDFKNLQFFNENFFLTHELLRVVKARDNFLAELQLIKNAVADQTREAAKKEVTELHRQKQSLKFPHKSLFSEINEKKFVRATEPLSLGTMGDARLRQVTIRLDIKGFYSKLAELGFYSLKRNSPISIPKLIFLNDYDIISFYNTLIRSYLN